MRIIIVLQIHSRIYDAKDVFFYRLFEISNGILFESKTKQLILRINSWLLLIGKLMIITTWLWKIRLFLSIDIFNNYKNQKLLQKSIQSENNDKLLVLFYFSFSIVIFSRNLIILNRNDHNMWSYQIKCASFSRKSMT